MSAWDRNAPDHQRLPDAERAVKDPAGLCIGQSGPADLVSITNSVHVSTAMLWIRMRADGCFGAARDRQNATYRPKLSDFPDGDT